MTLCSRVLLCLALVAMVAGAGCGDDDSPTSPTDTSTTPPATTAEPTISEEFTGSLPVGGVRFYSFDVTALGTVNITLDRVGGVAGVPATIWVGIGVGTPDGTDCSTTASLSTQSGGGPHISTSLAAGTYCARIYDIGNLAAPAPFAVTIAHP
jgi:hypothetical protein